MAFKRPGYQVYIGQVPTKMILVENRLEVCESFFTSKLCRTCSEAERDPHIHVGREVVEALLQTERIKIRDFAGMVSLPETLHLRFVEVTVFVQF